MLSEILQKTSIFEILYKIDLKIAEKVKAISCPYCGSPLHYSNYERKPRGGLEALPDQYRIRFSLCCSHEDCRRRTLPPSTRFMGRKVYWFAVILSVLTRRLNMPDESSAREINENYGPTRETYKRWISFFKNEFPFTRKWKYLRGRIISTVRDDMLPGSLVNYFINRLKSRKEGLIACLKFFATGPPYRIIY